ncbi:MAG: MarR family transcriptional regulator [Rhodobacteraceae bacterium]|nr:MarR family transcriptional regulator [Paracoccaceae bacterium]
MSTTLSNDPLAITLFSEIAVIDQMARTRLSRALPEGMELSHFVVLNHFSHMGGEKTPAQLARMLHVTKGAMTNTVRRLLDAGFIHIRPDWDDARKKWISLSPAGQAARDRAVLSIEPVFADIMAALGANKIRALLPVFRELRSALLKV